MFIDNPDPDWIEGSLSDIANITMGQSPSGSSYNEDGIGTIFFQGRVVLCQDLVQVKMSFSHSNLPAIPKLPVDTIFQNHRVTYNRNDYEFVWYYKTFPSIQIPGGMHVCNC